MRRLSFLLEIAVVRLFLGLAGMLGPVRASNLGGALARWLGPLLPAHRVARRNLALALPERAREHRAILRAAWDNLGRDMGELPHLARLSPTPSGPGWEIEGEAHLAALRLQAGPAILFSAHLANWEMLTHALARSGIPAAGIYRAPDNPFVDRLLLRLRGADALPLFPKGANGARQALRHLAGGGALALLADQKMNDGLAVPFFGHAAMTAPALATLALRLRCPVVPGRVMRLGPARFRLVAEAPIALPPAAMPREEAIMALLTAVNDRIESWVRERPGEWLWQHRRWPKEASPPE